jgi:hypothetical protein
MSAWTNYNGVVVPSPQLSVVRPRFSLTSDILSFRRCSRQYGYFGNDGFVPAQATQIFYGTVIHQGWIVVIGITGASRVTRKAPCRLTGTSINTSTMFKTP